MAVAQKPLILISALSLQKCVFFPFQICDTVDQNVKERNGNDRQWMQLQRNVWQNVMERDGTHRNVTQIMHSE